MSVGLSLDVRQTATIVLTPQLQQAIRLLQLAQPELEATLDREIAANPFLLRAERASAPAGEAQPAARPGERARVSGTPDDGWWQPPQPAPADRTLGAYSTARRTFGDETPALEQRLTRPPGLREHLRNQLAADLHDPGLRDLAVQLVEFVDEDGYLREPDEELATLLGVATGRVAAARRALQACDPTGVGARDLAECLALQLAERDRLDPAMRAMLASLDLVARADYRRLERLCGVEREDIDDMIAEIRTLDPRPGARFAADEHGLAVPDLFVYRAGRGYRVELNTAAMPRILVDRGYYGEITAVDLDAESRAFVETRLQEATWLVRALRQRARTILRVGRAIFVRQRRFLEDGPRALQPLVLRDVAEAVGLHESTVSRAIAGKFAATPHGTFALKYFFTSRLAATGDGEDHAAEAVRVRIRRMIEQEDPQQVLSDDQIVRLLSAEGVRIARRTVAKYREAMGIPSSVERRRQKALSR